MIEMAGIPTTTVTRLGFTQILGNAFAGFGFPAEAPTVYEFPNAMFLPGSDLTPINENIDKIVYGLTQWQPKTTAKGVFPADPVTVSGKDFAEFTANVNALFLKNQWGDGLPIVPPTEAQVQWILTGTDLAPDTVVGSGAIMAKGGIPTVESIAVSLAMAGGRPEYLPVLLAVVDAVSQPDYKLVGSNPTTQDVFPAVIVNGPIAQQIRMSSGYGVLGPDSLHPAGATIGRALHLILQDLGGATPGVGTMAIYGAMRYTEAVVAEDEAGLPATWTTLAEDRGFKKGDNVVSVTPVGGAVNVNNTSTDSIDAKGAQNQFLVRTANAMLDRQHGTYGNDLAGLVLIPRTFAQALEGVGYSKEDVKQFLWENSQMSCALLTKIGHKGECTNGGATPVVEKASDMMVVVAGGAQSGHAYWMNPGMGTKVVSKGIVLPKNWDQLLKQAETDLGPVPAY
jgi:hypothetical protein